MRWTATAHAPRTPAAPVETRFRERIRAFAKAVERTHTGEDGEAIHDLRVAARRLTAFLRMWSGLIPDRCYRRIARDVRAVRRRAGRARDVEVLAGMLRERIARHDAPDDEALALLATLDGRLERMRLRAGKQARARRTRRLAGLLARAEQGMRKDLLSHLEAFEAAHAREQELRREAIEGMRLALESADDKVLHRARIAVKKWRYAVESLGGNGAAQGLALTALRGLQDALGTILDAAALRALVAERLGETRHERSPRTLAALLADLDAERSEQVLRFRSLGGDFLRSVEMSH